MVDIESVKLDIVEKLKPMHLDKIILFGSYAYGTPNEDSDIDICVIDDNFTNKMEYKREMRRLLYDIEMPMDIILVNNEYYEAHSDEKWLNTALYDVRREGVVLYEKK